VTIDDIWRQTRQLRPRPKRKKVNWRQNLAEKRKRPPSHLLFPDGACQKLLDLIIINLQ
jgi:hypothetical protein